MLLTVKINLRPVSPILVSLENNRLRRWRRLMSDYKSAEPHGHCVEACNDFLKLLEEDGRKGGIVTWNATDEKLSAGDEPWPRKSFPWKWVDGFKFHAAVLIDGYVVDWTARQFDEDAPFPAVFSARSATKLTREQARQIFAARDDQLEARYRGGLDEDSLDGIDVGSLSSDEWG